MNSPSSAPSSVSIQQYPLAEQGQGGGVMTARDYILDLRQRGFTVYANDQGLFVIPKRALTEQDWATIRARKWELMATVLQDEIWDASGRWVEMYESQCEKLRDANDRIAMQQMEIHWLRRDAALRRNPSSELDDDLLKKVRFLCHPDRHGGSKLANDVFVELQHITERRGARP